MCFMLVRQLLLYYNAKNFTGGEPSHILCRRSFLYELVKFGFLFSANAAMPRKRQHRKQLTKSARIYIRLRTFLLIRCSKSHMEQPPLRPQTLRQALLERYERLNTAHT